MLFMFLVIILWELITVFLSNFSLSFYNTGMYVIISSCYRRQVSSGRNLERLKC